jgi:hypothetical protein
VGHLVHLFKYNSVKYNKIFCKVFDQIDSFRV